MLADNIHQLAWMADETGALFWYNQRWFDYTGTTLEQMQGWGWEAVHDPAHVGRVRSKFIRHLASGEVWEDTFPLRAADGSYRWFLSRAVPIRGADGRISRWFGTNTDITEQREAEHALHVAKEDAERANRAKDEFLAALSHELRTPLTPVLLALSMLERDDAINEHVRADLRMMRRNVELETRLIDDLLDLTRITRGKVLIDRSAVDLHEVLQHAAQTCFHDASEHSGLTLQLDLRASESVVWGDPARLGQIFWNVLRNAIKFTQAGGVITLRSRNVSPGAIEVSITDTGIGIPSDVLPHIFNAFEQGGTRVTRQFGGLGLGLAICRTLLELHGGEITAHSAGRDLGAEFVIRLPVLSENDSRAHLPRVVDTPHPPKLAQTNPRTVLLVEDHPPTAQVLSRVLKRMGHHVHYASTCNEALVIAAREPIDFLVSDVGLPDGSGLDLMRELRRLHRLRGIALSGFGMEEDIARSFEAGFDQHLVKPVDLQRLADEIARLAAETQSSRE